jgi:hypothetical protein
MQIYPSLGRRKFASFWAGTIFAWIGNQVLIQAIPRHIRNISVKPLALVVSG